MIFFVAFFLSSSDLISFAASEICNFFSFGERGRGAYENASCERRRQNAFERKAVVVVVVLWKRISHESKPLGTPNQVVSHDQSGLFNTHTHKGK